jgi:hypothetical protein
MLTVIAGGSRFSHLLYLGSGEILSLMFSARKLPQASTTLTRFFRRICSVKESQALSDKLWDYLQKIIPFSKMGEDYLTFDSTVLERYGEQEGAKKGYNPKKKGRPSHNPLIAFLNKSKYVVNLWNRQGNASSGNNICGFFKSSHERIKEKIKIKGIIADSGFYLREFIGLLEEEPLTYIIAARLYYPLQEKIHRIEDWQEAGEGIWVSEFIFEHRGWGKPRRYIAVKQRTKDRPKATGKQLSLFKDEIDEGEYRYSVWITNSQSSPYDIWSEAKPRAGDENTIKENKEDFALGGFSMKNFYSTETAMVVRVFIYNIFNLFRSEILPSAEKTKRLKTIRYKYLIIPAQLGSSGNKPILRLSAPKIPLRAKLAYLYHKINQYVTSNQTNRNAFG